MGHLAELTYLGIITSALLLVIMIPLVYSMRGITLLYSFLCGFIGFLTIVLVIAIPMLAALPTEENAGEIVSFYYALLCLTTGFGLYLVISFERFTRITYRRMWRDRDVIPLATKALYHTVRQLPHWATSTTTRVLLSLLWLTLGCFAIAIWITLSILSFISYVMLMIGIIVWFHYRRWRERRRPHRPAILNGKKTHLSIVDRTRWHEKTSRLDRSYRKRPSSKI